MGWAVCRSLFPEEMRWRNNSQPGRNGNRHETVSTVQCMQAAQKWAIMISKNVDSAYAWRFLLALRQ
jgi:hypothetical protein